MRQATIIGYGALDDAVVTRVINFESAIRGLDHFAHDDATVSHWKGEAITGEELLVGEGQKTVVQEAVVRTYSDASEAADLILQVRTTDDTTWRDRGDTTGTISVTTTGCTGTGTAWSVTLGTGSGTVFTTPCLATQGRYYKDSTPLTLTTDYTITGAKQITLVSGLTVGVSLKCYWENEPLIRVAVNDYIETTEGFHRILSIPTATTMTLAWYPSTTLTGTHHPAKQIPSGEGETIFPLHDLVSALRLRVLMIPRNRTASPTNERILDVTVNHVPVGKRQYRSS